MNRVERAPADVRAEVKIVGVGVYTLADAARLTGVPAGSIRRWVGGAPGSAPLWRSQLADVGDQLELGFRDLIEARVVRLMRDPGLSLQKIRAALVVAREIVGDKRPLSTGRFRSDGKDIFWEAERAGGLDPELVDLTRRQGVFWTIVEKTLLNIDYEDDMAVRWWPTRDRRIVLDPRYSFGRPILHESGVPTAAIAEALVSTPSEKAVAAIFYIPRRDVAAAARFEKKLTA